MRHPYRATTNFMAFLIGFIGITALIALLML
jgi:hypothetical protein